MSLSVDVSHLTKRFGDFVAVNDVSFAINSGSIFGFLGPNGAGKSTVIRMLLGILPISSGSGTVLGFDICSEAVKIRSRVGYML
jgi:ABC-2 type transport system ATP-binding protein